VRGYGVDSILSALLVLGIVLLNGFFVAAEFALVKIRETQLTAAVAAGKKRAKAALRIVRNINRYLSATQLGITMASLALGWIGEPVFLKLLAPLMSALHVASAQARQSIAIVTGFVAITFLQIVIGELGPKWIAIQKPLPVVMWTSRPLQWFYLASFPLNWVLNRSAQWLLGKVGIEPVTGDEGGHSQEELRLLFLASQKGRASASLGWDIVLNALNLRALIVHDVMRPRKEIVGFDTGATIAECLEVAERTRYSRFPLLEGGNPDRALGVVHIKDLFAMRLKAKRGADLAASARKLIYVPETARLEKVLQLFLERRLHLAIVVDEYGGTTGMVTLENILEELVGQIQDEFDQEKPLLVKKGENLWELDGALPFHELEELAGTMLSEERISTVSGWVTSRLGGFPKPDDEIKFGSFQLRVLDLDGLRVGKLRLTRDETPATETGANI
jgi:CBS domain containing-hemolysin-like protein